MGISMNMHYGVADYRRPFGNVYNGEGRHTGLLPQHTVQSQVKCLSLHLYVGGPWGCSVGSEWSLPHNETPKGND